MGPLTPSAGPVRRLIAIGAHPDDIEIGCGGTLLTIAEAGPGLVADLVVLTGDSERRAEAQRAGELFLPGATVRTHFLGLRDGHLPAQWSAVKDALEAVAGAASSPDVVFTPRRDDAHQDHRLLAELAPTVWRDDLVLEYEIPKWDGDHGSASVYVPLSRECLQEKILLLGKAFPSQLARDWWDDEVFLGLARLRGVECRSRYAEAFESRKTVLTWSP